MTHRAVMVVHIDAILCPAWSPRVWCVLPSASRCRLPSWPFPLYPL